MRLSKPAYYADFAFYGILIAGAFIWRDAWLTHPLQLKAMAAVLLGSATWTLVEYVLHRFVFHGTSSIAVLHARHHTEPRAYIATPTWLSAGVIGGIVVFPAWLCLPLPIAVGFSTGFVLAFLWYGIAHHFIHHRPRSLMPLFKGTIKRHYRHHSSAGSGDFGLTTEFWDRVFDTRSGAR